MSKPKIELLGNEAPTVSARILADANQIEYEVDKRGRRIGVKQLEFIDVHKLKKIVGGDIAANAPALMDILAACSVVEIDGDPIPRPGTNLQIEALMTRIGFAGLNAVAEIIKRLNPDDETGQKDEIKN